MKRAKYWVAFKVASMLAGLATVLVISTGSLWYINQPKVPQELLKK